MSVDIRTAAVEPVRLTFDHLAKRLGPGKTPTRYQEGVLDIQPKVNFHYRPTWDPERDIYDPRRTVIQMADWDQLVDPRQYFYGTYVIERAKQQETQESNFTFVEKRGLLDLLPAEWRDRIAAFVVPVRHIAWAGNTNNCFITAYGYGAPVTSGAMFQTTDQLGVAQYITRIGLILGHNDSAVLEKAKQEWLTAPLWQEMRRLAEDSMVVQDWFELHVLQNFLIDGVVYPVIFDHFESEVARHGGGTFALLGEFMALWQGEAGRWTDAVIKRAAAESAENRRAIEDWIASWAPRVRQAVTPVAAAAIGTGAAAAVAASFAGLADRAKKAGLGSSGLTGGE